jgi:hypothetical protein
VKKSLSSQPPLKKPSSDSNFRRSEFLLGAAGQILVRHHLSAKGRGSGLQLDRVPDATLLWELREGKVVRATLYNSRAEALEAVGPRE